MTIELRDGEVVLRPLSEEDVRVILDAEPASDRPGHSTPEQREEALRKRVEAQGTFVDHRIDLAIERGGRLVGAIEARRPRQGLPPGAYELGIGVFSEQDRGHGTGTTAVRLFTEYLFSDPETMRVQASTWVGNTAMRRVFERLGFTYEGVMRSFMPSLERGRDDYALYAIVRSDLDAS